ncbi:MAG: hypothetical protein P0S93_06775, partial [Candidatus Neptunochlamydia sp.]|nr:hypothetical protein [Candidatus Neptunochlamydia sp.]
EKRNPFFDLLQDFKNKLCVLFSTIEEKSMRLIILFFYANNLDSLKNHLDNDKINLILERIDFLSLEINSSFDCIHQSIMTFLKAKSLEEDFKLLRHSISGNSYTIFEKLRLPNSKQKQARFKSFLHWLLGKKLNDDFKDYYDFSDLNLNLLSIKREKSRETFDNDDGDITENSKKKVKSLDDHFTFEKILLSNNKIKGNIISAFRADGILYLSTDQGEIVQKLNSQETKILVKGKNK